tara:strand:+ start:4202 stop:4888 length:687 start_codon:yes stop_codon:yes gene_type:complete
MSKVTKTFTFKVPDDYTLQEAANDSSVSFTYHGPHYLKVYLDKNNKFMDANETTLEEWTHEGFDGQDGAVLVNALATPLEASIFWEMKDSDVADLPQRTKTGPDGLEYKYPWPLPPHKAYQRDEMVWNPTTLNWRPPYPWHNTWMTWAGITMQAQSVQNRAQEWLDADSGGDSDLTVAWTKIKDEAANKVNAWSSAGFLPHEVQFRLTPEDSDAQAELANRPDEDSAV